MFTKGYSNCQSRDVNTHAANVGAEENPAGTRLFILAHLKILSFGARLTNPLPWGKKIVYFCVTPAKAYLDFISHSC